MHFTAPCNVRSKACAAGGGCWCWWSYLHVCRHTDCHLRLYWTVAAAFTATIQERFHCSRLSHLEFSCTQSTLEFLHKAGQESAHAAEIRGKSCCNRCACSLQDICLLLPQKRVYENCGTARRQAKSGKVTSICSLLCCKIQRRTGST